jgi:threonine dehydrogenase-like Zn-dependent dehydrogenase
MLATNYRGPRRIRVDSKPEPTLRHPQDTVVKVTRACICGSDLHLYNGSVPDTRIGSTFGHEITGVVEDVGSDVHNLKRGDRVLIPFNIACGKCVFCKQELYGNCHESNPEATAVGGIFGYSHTAGGYDGGQAEYVRVPYSDVGPIVVPDHLSDDQVLFLSDILPTGWMGAENADIEEGDTIAVWGCGPVGLFAIQSALIMGARRVIAIDHYPRRLELAKQLGAEILDYREVDVREALDEMTGGIGPDACIDCVGMESHGLTIDNIADTLKAHTFLGTERPHALRQMVLACRKGGRISIPGVYGGFADKFPLGQLMEKGLSVKSGQTHVQRYTAPLLKMIEEGRVDTTFLISHHASLEQAPEMYRHWHDEQDTYTKIVLKTQSATTNQDQKEQQHELA